jgi:uncharacterized protein involved in response to NO
MSANPEIGGTPRHRAPDGPALFRQAFRPFFFGAGLCAFVVMALWLPAFYGWLAVPTAFGPAAWHAHEMLFGYAAAAAAGFLLTAIPNWTGRMPLHGAPLAALAAAWLAGRIAMALSGLIGAAPAAGLDLLFPALLLAVVGREILAGQAWRNLPMALAVLGLLCANGLTHADALGLAETTLYGERLGLAVMAALIGLIGGRIVPSFTRNWLAKRAGDRPARLPAPAGRIDAAALVLLVAALGLWVARPDGPVTGALLVAAGVASAARLARWQGLRCGAEPLVWSLHLGIAWLAAGLVLLGLSGLIEGVPFAAGLHALGAGALGAMPLAVMTRATLGHTGRPLAADGATAALYLLVSLAAALRVASPFLADAAQTALLWAAAIAWCAAFALFLARYGRWLLGR